MKLIHLSDLHIGKRVNEFSMIEDQHYVFQQIISIIQDEKPDAVLISGDVYDKSIPSEEAVSLCNEFFTNLSLLDTEVCVISGNHDSAERLSFGAQLFEKAHIHIASAFHGEVETVLIPDKDGNTDMEVFMLPFVKPSSVRRFYEDETIVTYDDAVNVVMKHTKLNRNRINVLMAHQFITGFISCESEEKSVGGIDQVSAEHFKNFDYVALGHIHGPQNISLTDDNGKVVPVRYCGTPLKYSFSEMKHQKSVTIVEFSDVHLTDNVIISRDDIEEIMKQDEFVINQVHSGRNRLYVRIDTRELTPFREMREIRGTYEELTLRDFYKDMETGDYLHVILTDEEDVPDALARLRTIYPNIMKFDYDNKRTRQRQEIRSVEQVENKTPLELFSELYEMQNNQPLAKQQEQFMTELVDAIWK